MSSLSCSLRGSRRLDASSKCPVPGVEQQYVGTELVGDHHIQASVSRPGSATPASILSPSTEAQRQSLLTFIGEEGRGGRLARLHRAASRQQTRPGRLPFNGAGVPSRGNVRSGAGTAVVRMNAPRLWSTWSPEGNIRRLAASPHRPFFIWRHNIASGELDGRVRIRWSFRRPTWQRWANSTDRGRSGGNRGVQGHAGSSRVHRTNGDRWPRESQGTTRRSRCHRHCDARNGWPWRSLPSSRMSRRKPE